MDTIKSRYLLVIGIDCFLDRGGRRFVDHLWYKDLSEHLNYIENLTLAAPCAARQPTGEAIEIGGGLALERLSFVDLPSNQSFWDAVFHLPQTLCLLWKAIGDAEIVHTGVGGWPIPLGWLAAPIAIIRRRKLVIIVESAFWRIQGDKSRASVKAKIRSFVSEMISRWCVNQADLSIFTQPEYRRTLLTRAMDRGHVINASWIDNDKVLSDIEASQKWEQKLTQRALKILFASRLVTEKGVMVLLEAMKQLDQQGVPVCLDVLGEGELRDVCVATGRVLANSAALRFLGTVSYEELFPLMSSYHAVVVPILSDEQPRIVFDAYSQAIPVVGSDADGVQACVEEGVSGMLARRNCPREMAAVLKKAQLSLSELRRMGMNGLKIARKKTHRSMHEERRALLLELEKSEGKLKQRMAR
jgi:glycosyltransferase involved in cell wall biosynthesis